MKKTALLFSAGMLLCTATLNATVCTASNNGNWSNATTWDCGHTPGNYDTMWVPLGFMVNVDINSPEYQGMLVIVDGILYFDNGQKLNICNGGVYVSSTGILAGDNPGSKINICGQTVWVGPDSTYGVISFGDVTLPSVLVDFDGGIHILEGAGDSTGTDINVGMLAVKEGANENANDRVNPINSNFALTVYPNPCNGAFSVNFTGDSNDEAVTSLIQIYNATGELVFEEIQSENDHHGGFTVVVNESDELATGVYLVRVVSGNEIISQHILIR